MVAHAPVTEPVHIPDIFVETLVRIEKLAGGLSRYVWATRQVGPDGTEELVVCAKIIMADAFIADAVAATLKSGGVYSVVEIWPKEENGSTAH